AASPRELAEVRVDLAHFAETGGRHGEVEELCDLAIEWFEGQGDQRRGLSLRRMRERARMEQGQPARKTLDALMLLDERAMALEFARERVAILTLASQTHGRLGDQATAERIAAQCVEMAEQLDDVSLLADALLRLGITIAKERPSEADATFHRALRLYETIGDIRGQARCHNCIGVVALFENRIEKATEAYTLTISIARAGGMPDLSAAGALNLGVLMERTGDYDRAMALLGEALASAAAIKHSEYQLIALFNMAHCERELGSWDAAAELYAATSPLAERIGQSDIEIGALAGAALCFLETGKVERARAAARVAEERLQLRPDWFQEREFAEALAIKMAAADGRTDEAVNRFERAVAAAEGIDIYTAAWLAAACAPALDAANRRRIQPLIDRYAAAVAELGYVEMTKRYVALGAAVAGGVKEELPLA
ncbi:MAG TPA: hypothetical protein VMH39_09925, partial [Gemmatimonadaceae bacterium]|nr:hypothetical protein [Gemmatimonadaceae bacterium]